MGFYMKLREMTGIMVILFIFCAAGCGVKTKDKGIIVFDANGGVSGSVPASVSYRSGEVVGLSGNTGGLVRPGFAFAGWNSRADGKGITYNEGFRFAGLDEKVTLYARWMASGSVDETFNRGNGPGGTVECIVLQNDGKIILAGNFGSYNAIKVNNIVRINPDGTVDEKFFCKKGPDDVVTSIATQADGKIIIAGSFKNVNRVPRPYLARLNKDGSLDMSYKPGIEPGSVRHIALAQDGRVIASGWFKLADGREGHCVVRFGVDGAYDSSFKPALFDKEVLCVAVLHDGRVMAAGGFTACNGEKSGGIVALDKEGSVDKTFSTGSGSESVHDIAVQPDGKMIICGSFDSFNGANRKMIARINPDGSTDKSFEYKPVNKVNTFYGPCLQKDGKVLVLHSSFDERGVSAKVDHILRLNTDGSVDNSFDPGLQGFGKHGELGNSKCLAVTNDGRVLAGGGFNEYNGFRSPRIVLLNSDGSIVEGFNIDSGASRRVHFLEPYGDDEFVFGGEMETYNCVSFTVLPECI